MQKIRGSLIKYLRWSEEYFKTDMLYLVKGGFWLSTGQAISVASTFILSIAFANLLPKETYGTYKYILSLVGILAIPTLGGINTAIIQAIAKGHDGAFLPALKTKIRWGILGAFGSLIVSIYYYTNNNLTLAAAFLIAAIFVPIMDSLALFDSFLQAKKEFKRSTNYSVISQLFATTCLFLAIWFTRNLLVIVFVYLASWTLIRYIFLRRLMKELPEVSDPETETISYGKHLSFMTIINSIAGYLDRLLIFYYLGPVEVAIYSIAIAPPEQLKAFISLINNLALPKFTARLKTEKNFSIAGKIINLTLLTTTLSFIYIVTAPYFFHIFFPKYVEAILYSQLFAISFIATAAVLPYTLMLARASKRELYFFNTSLAILQISSLLILTYFFGVLGTIISRIITRFYSFGLSSFFVREKNRN